MRTGQGSDVETAGILHRSLKNANPGLDTLSVSFQRLSWKFVALALNNNGRIDAETANFYIRQFNDCRRIEKYINTLDLPDDLKHHFAKSMAKTMIGYGKTVSFDKAVQSIASVTQQIHEQLRSHRNYDRMVLIRELEGTTEEPSSPRTV